MREQLRNKMCEAKCSMNVMPSGKILAFKCCTNEWIGTRKAEVSKEIKFNKNIRDWMWQCKTKTTT